MEVRCGYQKSSRASMQGPFVAEHTSLSPNRRLCTFLSRRMSAASASHDRNVNSWFFHHSLYALHIIDDSSFISSVSIALSCSSVVGKIAARATYLFQSSVHSLVRTAKAYASQAALYLKNIKTLRSLLSHLFPSYAFFHVLAAARRQSQLPPLDIERRRSTID